MNDSNNPNRTFAVGNEVSMGFNGDWYPVGTVASISKTGRKLVTSTGTVAWRNPRGFYKVARTFTVVHGVHQEQNPHF